MTTSELSLSVESISEQVLSLVGQSPTLIQTDMHYQEATRWFAIARLRRKEAEAFFDKLIKPHRQAIKDNQDSCKAVLKPLADKEGELNTAILAYRSKLAAAAVKEQERQNHMYEQRVEKAVEKGKEVAEVRPPAQVAAPATTLKTDAGAVTFTKIKRARLFAYPSMTTETKNDLYRTDLALHQIPDEYWQLDWVKIGRAVKAGIQVPGVQPYEDEGSRVRGS